MEKSCKFKNILFVFALEKEATPFKNLLNLPSDPLFSQNLIVSSYSGIYNSIKVSVVHPKMDTKFNVEGIGPENAAVATYLGSKVYQPDLIISVGTAVAFPIKESEGIPFKVGDVVYSKEPIAFVDREIILDEFKEYMAGKYDIIILQDLFSEMGFKEASIGTTSCFHDFAAANSVKKGVYIQEMEAAAIQKIAYIMNIPFFALKIVASLNYGKEQIEDITKNYFEHVSEESELLAGVLKKMLEKMS